MKMFKLLSVLYRIGLRSPVALFRLFGSIIRCGPNLLALLRFAAANYGNRTALVDERETLSYRELFAQAERLSAALQERYGLAGGKKAELLCKNHASLAKAIYAASSSGADVYLLNAEMSAEQFASILERRDFDLLVYDEEHRGLLERVSYSGAAIPD